MKIVDSEKCCGCEACVNSCPFNAISMIEDVSGFKYPCVDDEQCKKCGKCLNVCPSLKEIPNIENLGFFAGHISDMDELNKSASGGAIRMLSQVILANQGYVSGCVYDNDFFHCKHIVTNNGEDLERLSGTKYIQSNKNRVYREIEQLLKNGEKVFFVGLPCEVIALKSFLKKDFETLYTCDLICHGTLSRKAQEQFIKKYEDKYNSACVYYNIKEKSEGWNTPRLKMIFKNGKVFERVFYRTVLGDAFENMPRTSCMKCLYKANKRMSDITCGDFWGCKLDDSIYEKKGVSVLVVHTKKGMQLVKQLKGFEIKEISYDYAIENNKHYEKSCVIQSSKNNFKKEFEKTDIFQASNRTTSIIRRMYTWLKNIEEILYIQK